GALVRITQRGGLGLATSTTAVKRLIHEAKARTDAGLNAHMVTPAEVKKMSGGRLNLKGVQTAICYPDEGSIHPLTLLAQFAHDARALGAQFVGGARVVDAKEVEAAGQSGKRNWHWQLKLEDGSTVQAPVVIKAVGPTAAPTARIYALAFE